jgi:hypothetical protein
LLCAALVATPARSAQESLSERDATVLNQSRQSINELYVSPATSDQWGADRLGERTLQSGDSFRLHLGRTRECLFDAKVIYDDASREERRGLDLCRTHQFGFDGRAASPPAELSAQHQVTLVNNSSRPIQQVFVSSAVATQWGDDLLGNSSISVADARPLTWRGDCVVDLRIVFENRAAEERRGIDLCASPVLSIEPGWTTMDVLPGAKADASH